TEAAACRADGPGSQARDGGVSDAPAQRTVSLCAPRSHGREVQRTPRQVSADGTASAALSLHLSFFQWVLVGLPAVLVLSLELMHQAIIRLVRELQILRPEGQWKKVEQLATAAVVLASLGGSVMVALIYWQRIREMFSR